MTEARDKEAQITELRARVRELEEALVEWRVWAGRNGLGSGDERLIAALETVSKGEGT